MLVQKKIVEILQIGNPHSAWRGASPRAASIAGVTSDWATRRPPESHGTSRGAAPALQVCPTRPCGGSLETRAAVMIGLEDHCARQAVAGAWAPAPAPAAPPHWH